MSDIGTVKSQPAGATPCVDAVLACIADRTAPAVLDSADIGPPRGRFTIVAFDPVETVAWRAGDGDPFEGLRRHLARTRMRQGGKSGESERVLCGADALPFVGGWIGYFAYEAGRHIERLPATTTSDVGLPLARFGFYDSAAIHDAVTGRWTLVAADRRSGDSPSAEARLAEWQRVLGLAETTPSGPPPPLPAPNENMTRPQYLNMVARAKEYIAAGDIFQVNLARRETYPTLEPPVTTYRRLRRTNPGAYSAFIAWSKPDPSVGYSQAAVLSSSPELFLQLRDGHVVTRPIKGTRPRSSDAIVEAARRMELATSEKDRAELAMIVDLERNDLGRVCRFGSISVESSGSSPAAPYELETHPTVHHLVATVTGRLDPGRDAIDLLRSCFPGGSITGAPKVRAMEIIDELEPTERSVYTGSIGVIGLDGSMMFNIAIRTLIVTGGRTHVYAGGGIVADSKPRDEYDETVAKALGMKRSLGFQPPGEWLPMSIGTREVEGSVLSKLTL